VNCSHCGKRTGMASGVCLPCEVGLKSVRGAAQAFRSRCVLCNKELTSMESRSRGYGPACWEIAQQAWFLRESSALTPPRLHAGVDGPQGAERRGPPAPRAPLGVPVERPEG